MNDSTVTHNGVTYFTMKNVPSLKTSVETCPGCGGGGEMFGRDCTTCKGKGLVFPPLRVPNSDAG